MADSKAVSDSKGDRASSGERTDALLKDHLPELRAFVRARAGRFLLSREESSDLVQSTCREILSRRSRFRSQDEESFRRWLHATALRKIVDRARFHQAGKRHPDRLVTPHDSGSSSQGLTESHGGKSYRTPSRDAMSREELSLVEEAFRLLPEDSRDVILLSRIMGLPHREVARRMGRSEGAVRVLLSRALARLSTLTDSDDSS